MISSRWDVLAVEVRARREALHLSHDGVARRGGPSHETVRLVEAHGRPSFRAMTLLQLDRGLGWKHGTARAIVDGTASGHRHEWVNPDSEATPSRASTLRTVPDVELAGEMVARLTRRDDTGANRELLSELAAWIDRDTAPAAQ